MRLFIAINFNEGVIDDLVRLQAELTFSSGPFEI